MELNNFRRLFGLIGYPLSHSFSKKHFGDKFGTEGITDQHYELFPLEKINQLPTLIKKYPNLRGLNVTAPYKKQVFDFLDDIDPEAKAVGAVNTILIHEGKLKGYNTDVFGFEKSLLGVFKNAPKKPRRALILGTGGASQAVAYVLDKQNIEFLYVSRRQGKEQLTYEEIMPEVLEEFPLIVNTTPLGTYPAIENAPKLPYDTLTEKNILFDLVYNPAETLFLQHGKTHGAQTKNGLEMLYWQAERAWEIWNHPA